MIFSELTQKLGKVFEGGGKLSDADICELELAEWLSGDVRKMQLTGLRYYEGKHDITEKRRLYPSGRGRMQEIGILPNAKIIDNQFKKMINQKANYILGKPLTFEADNTEYVEYLSKLFGKEFHKVMKRIAKESLLYGIAWMYPYIDDGGKFRVAAIPATEILPFWLDEEHTRLEFAARVYRVTAYEGAKKTIQTNVELFTSEGVDYYIYREGKLIEDVEREHSAYVTIGGKGYNWDKIPLIPFKYNTEEIPLICDVKSLQDGINELMSNCQDAMLSNPANTILILKNYDGENLSEFRQKLIQYGAIKVRSVNGVDGGVETLNMNMDAGSYETTLELLKKALIENAMGYDAKDDRIGSNANQMNIQSMYSDIDLDADGMETEFQASLHEMLWFVEQYAALTGAGDFSGEDVRIIFNRDMMMNESEIMQTLISAGVRLSQETLISQVPFIRGSAKDELERVKQEEETEADYSGSFEE